MDDLLLTPMVEADLEQVLVIEAQGFADPWVAAMFRSEFRHEWSHCQVLRRRSDRRLLGYLVFWSVVDELQLLNVAVDPVVRNQGLGRHLMDHLDAYARDHGARLVTLEVRRSNGSARRLYDRAGFKQVGVRPRYYASNDEDAIVMTKQLTAEVGL